MSETITNKVQMYQLLAAGKLGNTIPQYFSVEEWRASGDQLKYDTWGVRTLTPGGPCRLYCPVDEVEQTVKAFQEGGCKVNISCMIDAVFTVTLMAEILDTDSGLMVYGVEYPVRLIDSWRSVMPSKGKSYYGLKASMLLKKHLNANSLDDLNELRERWPGHVIEFSATEQCLGRLEHRNYCSWEIRNY